MSGNTISVDPRIVTPLACFPGDLSRYPKDTLHRVAITLDLLSELLGNYNGEADLLGSDDHRFALSAQLSNVAGVLEALGEVLQIRTPMKRENEVIIEFASDELEKLTILAARKQKSIHDTIQGIVIESLRACDPGRRNGEGAK